MPDIALCNRSNWPILSVTAREYRFDNRNDVAQENKCEAKMAYVNSRSSSVSIADRFAAFFKVSRDSFERRRVFNQTVAELSNLSDRDLADLGLVRANIADIAREAAYLK